MAALAASALAVWGRLSLVATSTKRSRGAERWAQFTQIWLVEWVGGGGFCIWSCSCCSSSSSETKSITAVSGICLVCRLRRTLDTVRVLPVPGVPQTYKEVAGFS